MPIAIPWFNLHKPKPIMPIPTLEQYSNRVIATHPELVHQFIDEDLATAQARFAAAHAEAAAAQVDIDALFALKNPVAQEVPVVYDGGQPQQS